MDSISLNFPVSPLSSPLEFLLGPDGLSEPSSGHETTHVGISVALLQDRPVAAAPSALSVYLSLRRMWGTDHSPGPEETCEGTEEVSSAFEKLIETTGQINPMVWSMLKAEPPPRALWELPQ